MKSLTTPSHCVALGCSDPNNPAYKLTCEGAHSHDEEKCEYCEQINDVLRAMHGLLSTVKEQGEKDGVKMTEEDFQELLNEIDLANDRIYAYKTHIMRTWVQMSEWSHLFENMKEGQAFITADWAQKVKSRNFIMLGICLEFSF